MAPPVEVIVTAAVSDVAEVAPAPEASSKSSVVEPTSAAQIDAAPSAELVEGACSAVSRACHWQKTPARPPRPLWPQMPQSSSLSRHQTHLLPLTSTELFLPWCLRLRWTPSQQVCQPAATGCTLHCALGTAWTKTSLFRAVHPMHPQCAVISSASSSCELLPNL